MPVSMPTIGRITDGRLTSTNMREPNALVGKLKKIRRPTRTAAKMSIVVAFATGGKKWSTIQITTKLPSVATRTMTARKVTVPTTTTRRREDIRSRRRLVNFLSYFLVTVAPSTHRPPSTKSIFTRR